MSRFIYDKKYIEEIFMIGLKKGMMNCEGVGPRREWIITYMTEATIRNHARGFKI